MKPATITIKLEESTIYACDKHGQIYKILCEITRREVCVEDYDGDRPCTSCALNHVKVAEVE